MEYHPVVSKIVELLKREGAVFETFEHEAVRTSEEASKVRTGYTIEQGAKAIVARVKEPGKGKSFVMFVLPGSKRFDSEKIRIHFDFTDIRFATEEEVATITEGVLPGGVPPFGNLFGLRVFADATLITANEKIVFNAGDRRFSVGMRTDDYRRLVDPQIADITQ